MLRQQLIGLAIVSLTLVQVNYAHNQATVYDCRNNFTLVTGKCLLAVNVWLNWYEADRYCHTLGSELLSVTNLILLQKMTNWIIAAAPYTLEFWTSGNCLGKKGTFYWQSTGELTKYMPWASGQPQQANGDCLTLYTISSIKRDFRLMVRNCLNMEPFVCEQRAQKTSRRICLNPLAFENNTVLL